MKKKALIVVIVILVLILVAGLGFIAYMSLSGPAPEEPTVDSLPGEPQQATEEDVALPEQTTQEPQEVPTTTAPEIVLDEDNNEWGALTPYDTQPAIPEIPTTEATEPPHTTQPATTAPEPTEDNIVGELPGLGENDTPWN